MITILPGIVSLLVGLCATLLAGCSSTTPLSLAEATAARSLLIVPVEAPPALVYGTTRAGTVGLCLAGGAIGTAAHNAATEKDRLDTAGQLKKLMRDWRMDQAMVEECAGVLKLRSVKALQDSHADLIGT
jgi:hypothetical protein